MCNLYSVTTNRQAIIDFAKATKVAEAIGNMPPQTGVFPDYEAPIVRNTDDGRELAYARWGMPSPAFVIKGKKTDSGVTNIRNTKSLHWRRWLSVEHRCVVPFTSFSEYDTIDGKKVPVWFATDESRPLQFFAGLHVPGWKSTRKVKEGEVTSDLFGFLTCEPNADVGKIHPKAMPVILANPDEIFTWLQADWREASVLQRPLPNGSLQIVARGERKDGKDQ